MTRRDVLGEPHSASPFSQENRPSWQAPLQVSAISADEDRVDGPTRVKRAIAREVSHLITKPQPAQSAADLRPARQQLGLTITQVADALGYGIAKISRIERGHIRDTRFLHEYRDWLTTQQPLKTAA